MVSPLTKKLLRDLWRLRGQVLAISLVIGAGVAVFVMSMGTLRSLEEIRAAYYERHRFAEVFAQAKRAPERLKTEISRIPGIKRVETRIVEEVILDIEGLAEPATGRLISTPEGRPATLNLLYLREGRSVARAQPDEVVMGEAMMMAHGFRLEDRLQAVINGRKRTLTIIGVGLSPEYVYSIPAGALMPDDKRFGVLWMGREALEAAFDMDGAFNDVALTLQRDADATAVVAALDRLLEPYGGAGAYQRKDQLSHWYLQGEMDQLKTLIVLIPPIFFGVAAFLLNIVLGRLVATEREQIGLLKAFGYTNRDVALQYLKLALALVMVGILVGFGSGAWFGRVVTGFYADFFRFPFLYYRLSTDVFALAAAIGVMVAALGTLGAVRQAVALPPAEAMAPAPPTFYRKTLLEHLILLVHFGEPTRMILRHIIRWPLRSSLTVLGVSLGMALLVGTLFFIDAIDHLMEVYFYRAQRADFVVTLVNPRGPEALHEMARLPGVLSAEPIRIVPAKLRAGHRERRASILGVGPEADLMRLLDEEERPVPMPPEGLALSVKLAEALGVGLGDEVTVQVTEGRRPKRTLHVVAVSESYIGTPAYMGLASLNRLMGEGAVISGANLMVDARHADSLNRRLKDTPAVAAVTVKSAAVESFEKTMAEAMMAIISFYIGFAGAVAFGVVYNSAQVSLSERARELASLRVLGFTRGEVAYILLGELGLMVLFSIPLGGAIGYGLAWFWTVSLDTDLYRIPLVVEPATYGIAVLVVVVAGLISGLLVRRRLDGLNLVEVLKTRE